MEEQMSYVSEGHADFNGDLSTQNWGWMEGLMSDLPNDISPHSSHVDVSVGHHSPTDSSYNSGSLGSLEPSSPTGGNHGTNSTPPVVDDRWFGYGGPLQSSGGYARSTGEGFGRSPGIDQQYASVGLQGFSDPPLQRKPGLQHDMSRNAISGSMSSGVTQSTNESVAKFSRDGSVSSISSGGGICSYDGSSLGNCNTYVKPSGEYQFRQTSSQKGHDQQRQQISSNTWGGQPNQQRRQYQQHHQHPQRQYQQQDVQQQILEPQTEDCALRLLELLVACAQSIQMGDRISANSTVKQINEALATVPQQTGPFIRVAAHFAEALTRRIFGLCRSAQESLLSSTGITPESHSEILHFHFYETCPYLKFAHFTANQAILEAFKGAKQVHVIDLNLNHGLQWPALIQALALRPGGPPTLKLTGIGPQGEDSLHAVGENLRQLAESVKVKFKFRGVSLRKLDELKPWSLEVSPGEVVAVNSMMQLHKLLACDESNPTGIDVVLRAVRSLNPKIVTMSEQEADHNCPNFSDRFMHALHFYSSMFDSLEASNYAPGSSERILAEMYLGREICDIVGYEGVERLERHETLAQWRARLRCAGFEQICMGPDAFKQSSLLLTLFSSLGYRVEDDQGCLTLCWHGQPLIAASAWHCS